MGKRLRVRRVLAEAEYKKNTNQVQYSIVNFNP